MYGLPYVYLCAKAINSDRKVSVVALNWRAIDVFLYYIATIQGLWVPKMLGLEDRKEEETFLEIDFIVASYRKITI